MVLEGTNPRLRHWSMNEPICHKLPKAEEPKFLESVKTTLS